jgi:hypothetical protein
MSSQSLAGLLAGVDEVRALRTRYPVPRGGIATGVEAVAAKAHGRACVVLLSSHLERYIRALNEEAVEWLNHQNCGLDRFTDEFLLMHSRGVVDDLAKMSWDRRGPALRDFVSAHATFWGAGGSTGAIQHDQLLVWMKAPKPESLVRFFKLYGIENIFNAATRKKATRGALYLGIRELVEKRNNIAHGDAQTEALPTDVTRYLNAVSKFANSADGSLARALKKIASTAVPW